MSFQNSTPGGVLTSFEGTKVIVVATDDDLFPSFKTVNFRMTEPYMPPEIETIFNLEATTGIVNLIGNLVDLPITNFTVRTG